MQKLIIRLFIKLNHLHPVPKRIAKESALPAFDLRCIGDGYPLGLQKRFRGFEAFHFERGVAAAEKFGRFVFLHEVQLDVGDLVPDGVAGVLTGYFGELEQCSVELPGGGLLACRDHNGYMVDLRKAYHLQREFVCFPAQISAKPGKYPLKV